MKRLGVLFLLIFLLAGCWNPNAGTTAPDTTAAPTTAPTTEPTTAPTTVPTTAPTTAPTEPTAAPVQTATDFKMYDMEGNACYLSDYFGKPIVLNFWASWCGPCKAEMPEFNAKYLELGDQIQFIMLNLSASDYPQDARNLISQEGYQFPVFWDRAEEGGYRYHVSAIPMTVFIDADGQIVEKYVGMMDKETLEHFISLILPE